MDSLWGRRRRGDGDVAGERSPGRRRRKLGRQRFCILVTTALTGAALIAVLLSMLIMVNGEKELFRTLQVHVIFRHGERTPTDTYPNDPYKADDYWPEGWGQLTNKGKMQLYELGVYLRSRYGGTGLRALLDGAYQSSETKILSSYADRCIASAGVLLAGMFPPSASPGGSQVWLDALDWQPVPIRYRAKEDDNIIVSKKPCPRYDADLKAVYASPEVQIVNKENKDLYDHLTENAGKTYSSVLDVEFLYNTLQIEEIRGLELPDWVKGWYPERMRPLASLSLALFTRTLPMKRTKSGVLLGQIGDHMNKKISTKDDSKVYLYSGHDTTIVNMLQALGVGEDSFKPEFGAAILVELLEAANGDKHVQVLLKNSTSSEELFPIELPDCLKPCKIENFLKLPAITTPEQWENECKI
ncbi:hypothetical protein J437_LFUL001985 [Ladona fulva]|uniref:Acid phosphatase n=1 Tax=Ladona fulva TaxID=123851 RepID=A0A8K0JY12_LADFU|nr:hypothetical protein J437_LFUL001985 [Ladona fulva]